MESSLNSQSNHHQMDPSSNPQSKKPSMDTPDLESKRQSSSSPQTYTQTDFERLGRERPASFSSLPHEIGFCFALLGSMFVAEYMISGFSILLPPLASALSIPSNAKTWPSSVFSLITGAFLLPFGRLADMYGGYIVFNVGLAWFIIWSVIAGFSQNYQMLIACRALQGFGPAAFLPSGIMLLGSIYRPGPRKNLVFSLYGAFAPVGFFAGIFLAGVAAQFITWRWWFWIGSIMLAIVALTSYFCIPKLGGQTPEDWDAKKNITMDWWGTATVVPGLVLIIFALTDGSHAPDGWATPYIPVTLVLGIAFLAVFIYIEGWVAEQPFLPSSMFRVKGMKTLTVALFLFYGTFGIFIFYASFYIEDVVGATPLLTATWFTPMCVGGLILSTVGGLILHLLPGRALLLLSGAAFTLTPLLFAILPNKFNYWAYIFPSMICSTLGIDITYNVSNIFITTSLPKAQQGLAGSFMNSLLFLGIAVFLSLADLVVKETEHSGKKKSYQYAFWMATALAGAGLIIMFLGVKIGKAKSELTLEEKEDLEKELIRHGSD
ncbi:ProP Permease of the major facilitator superfamily [Pyrenophora tritici-repentis]|uniref:Major facilitator superfamily transporter n=2 Tax=Pyrenophora tritici-repentis TaxID=45151 RepID=A0A2W1GMV8_9PLEO|nr:membrane transporter [Pyrenophora tritici-repentis Pt-1C-BFP]KAA8621540.1 Major facilitator superfamily transporter [Pyrenophora tritici-repentis]EDU43104.1 membrane transporter [Pyrenophora tritici-repentis Pt-1C-BFP]KAF7450780.1 Major facilitator superfamily transporter [Pyrenophora tritici-repentis]KAF7573431.1 ProP, Permease major facilitator superfamily [Pyrenophora tritici-repentis]KAG9381006.1 Major facilitator superfamily transporter [Pyrenophora tritici-repentis]